MHGFSSEDLKIRLDNEERKTLETIGTQYGLTLKPELAETVNKIKDSTYFFNWLVLYSRIDYWGKGYEQNTLQMVINGISTYFYQTEGHPVKFTLNFKDKFYNELLEIQDLNKLINVSGFNEAKELIEQGFQLYL